MFLSDKPKWFQHIQFQAKKLLADAAAVHATRWKLYESLQATGLGLETGSGGVTKFNRTRNRGPKTHFLDATCVGKSTPMMPMDKYGFPRAGYQPKNPPKDWKTGDIVRVGQKVVSVSCRYIQPIFRHDGYGYEFQRSPIMYKEITY